MRRGLATTAAAVALPLLAAGSAGAQTTLDDLSREIDALKRGQIEMQKQLAEISRQLQTTRRAAAPSGPDVEGKTFTLAANPVKGDPAARLTLIEFLDFQ